MLSSSKTTKSRVLARIQVAQASKVWTPVDFIDIGNRDVVDKTLQRLTISGDLQRIDRGLYIKPRISQLTKKATVPDYQKIIDAVSRREQIRILIDGMSAANSLGLTNAVPGQVIIHTDGRLRPIQIGNLHIQFKLTTPRKLYWAGRPAMYVVQALYWLRDTFKNSPSDEQTVIENKLIRLLSTSAQGAKIRQDLADGFHTLPMWMQKWLRLKVPSILSKRKNNES